MMLAYLHRDAFLLFLTTTNWADLNMLESYRIISVCLDRWRIQCSKLEDLFLYNTIAYCWQWDTSWVSMTNLPCLKGLLLQLLLIVWIRAKDLQLGFVPVLFVQVSLLVMSIDLIQHYLRWVHFPYVLYVMICLKNFGWPYPTIICILLGFWAPPLLDWVITCWLF